MFFRAKMRILSSYLILGRRPNMANEKYTPSLDRIDTNIGIRNKMYNGFGRFRKFHAEREKISRNWLKNTIASHTRFAGKVWRELRILVIHW